MPSSTSAFAAPTFQTSFVHTKPRISGSAEKKLRRDRLRLLGRVVAAEAAEDLDISCLVQCVQNAARAFNARCGRQHMLNDRDLSALRQMGCHGAAHLQPDLIAVAADKAGAACGIDVRVDRNDADPGSDGFLRCFRAAVASPRQRGS